MIIHSVLWKCELWKDVISMMTSESWQYIE
jgi:hypothetical protein